MADITTMAAHEAGHAVISRVLGVPSGMSTIADTGHVAAPPSSVMNSRRLT
jgi:hypothetical protein